MTQIEKLFEKFKTIPADLEWNELIKILRYCDFKMIEGRGSRVKFYNQANQCVIQIHRPHPQKIVKRYVIRQILKLLHRKGLL